MDTKNGKETYESYSVIEDTHGKLIRPVEPDAPAGLVTRLRGSLPSFKDDGQRRAFKNILRFLALVLVFTLIARGTSAATMPRVALASPQRAEIADTVSAPATVKAAYTQPIQLPKGLVVDQALVVPGQKVNPEDPLFLLDTEKLATQQKREQIKLDEMNLNLQKLLRGEPYDSSALIGAQNTAAWSEADLAAARAREDAAIATANNAVNQAAAERDAAQNALNALKEDTSATEEQKKQAQERLAAAQAAVPAAEQARDAAVRSADDTMTKAARDLESAQVALAGAQVAAEKARREAADQKAQNALDAQAMELDIAEQQKLLETYQSASRDGHVYAGVSGTVLEILAAGDTVEDKPAALISDDSGGFRAEAMVDKTTAEQMSSGDSAEVAASGSFMSNNGMPGATVLSVGAPGENGMARVLFKLPAGDWKQGQNVTMTVTRSKQDYPLVVPLSAIHQGQNEYYVFLMETRSGVMGMESLVYKAVVNIEAKNNEYAAVSGPFGTDSKVVTSTTKPLADGDKVRMETK